MNRGNKRKCIERANKKIKNIPKFPVSPASPSASDVEVRLQPREKNVEVAKARVEALLSCPSTLSLLRTYLTVARLAPYTLTEEMQKVCECVCFFSFSFL